MAIGLHFWDCLHFLGYILLWEFLLFQGHLEFWVCCQAQSQLQLSWTGLALISTFPHPTPQGKYHGGHFKLVEPSLTVDKWSRTNLTMQNLSMQHLSMQHLSMQRLSWDKIWLLTIATTPVWTKQSNFKLATEPNQNLANSS